MCYLHFILLLFAELHHQPCVQLMKDISQLLFQYTIGAFTCAVSRTYILYTGFFYLPAKIPDLASDLLYRWNPPIMACTFPPGKKPATSLIIFAAPP